MDELLPLSILGSSKILNFFLVLRLHNIKLVGYRPNFKLSIANHIGIPKSLSLVHVKQPYEPYILILGMIDRAGEVTVYMNLVSKVPNTLFKITKIKIWASISKSQVMIRWQNDLEEEEVYSRL